MQRSRLHRPTRIRGAVLGLVTALLLAFPLGVLAAHQFGDVPNSNIFHGDIDALVDAGVTAGCGGGNYCPNQAVTRGQMAAFMNRLGALAPGKVPVVNADRLDGYHANGLIRVAGDAGTIGTTAITATFPTLQTATDIVVAAPAAGFVVVSASIGAQNTATTCTEFVCGVFVLVRHAQSGAVAPYQVMDLHGDTHPNASASLNFVFPVAAGNNTFQLQVGRANAGQSPSFFSAQITGIYTPFGSTGGSTLGVGDTPDLVTEGAGGQ
jgi:hypothetical protein